MDDAALRQAVLTALKTDGRLSSQPVEVAVEQGIVTLAGRVQSFRRKLVAQELAAAAAGPDHVENHLEVVIAEPLSDEEVAEDIRALLEEDARLVKKSVLVDVRAGRVTLSGSVASASERTLAEDVALRVAGAREVTNQLVIEPAALQEAVLVGRELELALARTPELEGCELRVAISGDTAVLSGTAHSPLQVEQALALIREAWVGELRQEVVLPD